MKILLNRLINTKEETLGAMYINGTLVCFTLEDEPRDKKVPKETRIPAGEYKIKLRNEGPLNDKYKQRFGDLHRGMLHLQNVPGFEYIYIHIGNTDNDTAGCILVGQSAHITNQRIILVNSKITYQSIYKTIVSELENGNDVWIKIENNN